MSLPESSPSPEPRPPDSRAPRGAIVIMIIIVAGMALVSLYSNIQRLRKEKIETVIVTPVGSPLPGPTAP